VQADPEREYAVAGVLCDLGADEGGLPLLLALLKGHHSAVAPQHAAVRPPHHHHQQGVAATGAGGLSSSWDASASAAVGQAAAAAQQLGGRAVGLPPLVRALGRPQLLALLSAACNLRKVRIAALECGALGVLVSEVHEAMRSILASPSALNTSLSLIRAASRAASMQLQPATSMTSLAGAAAGPVAQGGVLGAGSLGARMSDLQSLLSLLETLAAEAAARTAGSGAGTGQGRMEGVDSAVQVRQEPHCQPSYHVVNGAW
jgi:hypothetical protein